MPAPIEAGREHTGPLICCAAHRGGTGLQGLRRQHPVRAVRAALRSAVLAEANVRFRVLDEALLWRRVRERCEYAQDDMADYESGSPGELAAFVPTHLDEYERCVHRRRMRSLDSAGSTGPLAVRGWRSGSNAPSRRKAETTSEWKRTRRARSWRAPTTGVHPPGRWATTALHGPIPVLDQSVRCRGIPPSRWPSPFPCPSAAPTTTSAS